MVASLSLGVSLSCVAQSDGPISLESVWQSVWACSPKVRSATEYLEITSLEERLAKAAYAPSLKVSGDRKVAATGPTEEGDWNGAWDSIVSLEKRLAFGGSFSLDLADSVLEYAFYNGQRDLVFPSVALGFHQRLFPFWLYGGKFDPTIEGSVLKNHQADIQERKTRRDLAVEAAELYISIRRDTRDSIYLEESIGTLQADLDSKRKLQQQGSLSLSEIWTAEHAVWLERQMLLKTQASLAELREKLFILSGVSSNDILGLSLPDIQASSERRTSLEEEDLGLQIGIERQKWLVELQNASPLLEMSLARNFAFREVGWDHSFDTTYPIRPNDNWSFQASLKFPGFLSESPSLQRSIAKANMDELLNLSVDQRNQIESQRRLFEVRIEGLETQRRSLSEESINNERSVADAKSMFNLETISKLQLRQIERDALKSSFDLANTEDQLWMQRLYLAALEGWPE